MAGRFHNTVAAFAVHMCRRLRSDTGVDQVALSGGVLQNRRLFRQMHAALLAEGFTVLTHSQVPCNDGGVSLGQAVVASFAAGTGEQDAAVPGPKHGPGGPGPASGR